MRAALLLLLPLWACTPVPVVTPDPVPPSDTLQISDCKAAEQRYEALLALPGAPPNTVDFPATCRQRLAHHARRAILRCWRDAETPANFLECDERF